MKKPWLAFLLSFILPGAGLAYLRRWGWAVANFLIVPAIFCAFLLFWSERTFLEHVHYLILSLHAASGGIAHALARAVPKG